MKHQLTPTVTRISIILLVLVVVTGCPGPESVKKAIRRTESLQLNDQFEQLFNQSVNIKQTALVFNYVDKSPGNMVCFGFNPEMTHSRWELDVLAFQKKLKETNTTYQSIEIYNGSNFFYTSENLENYERTFRVFKENLQQIKEGRLEDLYRSMGETTLEFERIKELIDYVHVTNFSNFEVISYPPESTLPAGDIAFCLNASEKIKLYFSYLTNEEGVFLRRIDLNNFSTI